MAFITSLPPHARTVHRSAALAAGTANTTLYTVPAGATLYITSAYIIGLGDVGVAGITALSEDTAGSANIVVFYGVAAASPVQLDTYFRGGPLRIQSGTVVGSTLITGQPCVAGFSGWLESWNH